MLTSIEKFSKKNRKDLYKFLEPHEDKFQNYYTDANFELYMFELLTCKEDEFLN